MKIMKKFVALVLTMAMLGSLLVVPALAADYASLPDIWSGHIKGFPELCKNIDRNEYGDNIRALQRYLMCFDYTCKSKLNYNGTYMDGDFGGRTHSATLYLQEQLGFTGAWVDGRVGEGTWERIANTLKIYPKDGNRIRRPLGIPGEWVYVILPSDGFEYFAYFFEDNSGTRGV